MKPNKSKAYFKRFQVKYKRRRGETLLAVEDECSFNAVQVWELRVCAQVGGTLFSGH